MRLCILGVSLLLGAWTSTAAAADACAAFKWDVSREHAVFAGAPIALRAGADASSAPLIEIGRLYELSLHAQELLRHAAPPGKKMLADGASGGLVRLRVPRAGTYRVALSRGFWVDVVDAGSVIESSDFGGAPGCESPRKLVVYALPEGRELIVQLSGAIDVRVRLSVIEGAPAAR